MLKFRTMCVDAEAKLAAMEADNQRSGPLFKLARDPRVTKIGHVLRRTSLDELPQLLNVLKGDMSLVGPRPALRKEVEAFPAELHARHDVRPGITGLWQVEARDNPAFDAYQRLDLHYVENWSPALDLVILLGTAEQLLMRPFASKQRRRDGRRARRRSPPPPEAGAGAVMTPRPAIARRPAATWRGRRRRSRGRASARTLASSCQLAATAARSGSTPSASAARYAAPMAVVSGSRRPLHGGRRADRPGTAAARPSPTHHRRPAARAAAVRWPAPSPRRHLGSGTPSTRPRPGRGGLGSCRG